MKKTSTINEKAAIINKKLALLGQGRPMPEWAQTLCYLASAFLIIFGIWSDTDLGFYIMMAGFILYLLTSLEQERKEANYE